MKSVTDAENAVRELIHGTVSLREFELWAYESELLEDAIGSDVYLALLESPFETVEEVLRLLRPWAIGIFGTEVDLVAVYRVLALCRAVIWEKGELLEHVRALLSEASKDHRYVDTLDIWADPDWGKLAQISDMANGFPVGVDPKLVSSEFKGRMEQFEAQVRAEAVEACQSLVRRYKLARHDV
jgi:hypothetical protein